MRGKGPWDSPGKNIGVGCQFLLQGIFLTQGANLRVLCRLHCRGDSLQLEPCVQHQIHILVCDN